MNNERRFFARLKRSLPITLLGQKVKSKNISPEGVYFEVTTKDIENYSLGKGILIQIEVIYSKPVLPEKRAWVAGLGEIIRVDGIDINNHDKKLGVALKFCEEFKRRRYAFDYNKNLELGSLLDFKIDISKYTPTINCVGKIIRIEELQPSSRLRIEIKFIDIGKKEKETINTTVEAMLRKKTKYFWCVS